MRGMEGTGVNNVSSEPFYAFTLQGMGNNGRRESPRYNLISSPQ